jgi:hypothetical protein
MKIAKFLSAIIFLFVAVNFASCSSDVEPIDPAIIINPENPDNPNPDNPVPGQFKVDIDGTTYTTSTTLVYITGGSIQLTAIRPQGDSFGFLLGGTTAGTYAANGPNNLVSYTPAGSEYGYWGTNTDDENANTGSVIVTSVNSTNHTISGTFSYTGYWSDDTATGIAPKHFTNGSFTNLPYVTNSPTGDVFLAKINGTDFNQNDLLAITVEFGGIEFISIGAENAAGNAMTVSVKSSLSPGTYTITGNVATDPVQLNYTVGANDAYANAGTVTITEKTADRIKGTFTATVVIAGTTYQITAGSFDVAY